MTAWPDALKAIRLHGTGEPPEPVWVVLSPYQDLDHFPILMRPVSLTFSHLAVPYSREGDEMAESAALWIGLIIGLGQQCIGG